MPRPRPNVPVVVRRWLPACLVVLLVASAAWAAYSHAAGDERAPQPNALDGVQPGNVPVAPTVWTDHHGDLPVVVPAQAVAFFPYASSSQPAHGGEHFVQVLHAVPTAPRRGSGGAVAGAPVAETPLRFRVEVRAVTTHDVRPGYLALANVRPDELIAPHYVFSLGTGDLVHGAAPSMRLIDLPTAPVDVSVVVDRQPARHLLRIRVQPPAPGWTGVVWPIDGSAGVRLRARDAGRVLQATIAESTLGADERALLAQPGRPALNVAWLTVRDGAGQRRVDNPLRY